MSCFLLVLSQFLLSYTLFSCTIPYWKHYYMPCVSKARTFFFLAETEHGTQVLAAHFETIPAGRFLFLQHELMAPYSEEQKQGVAETPGSAQHTHSLQCAKHEEGQPPFPGAKSFSLALWGGRQKVKENNLGELIDRWHLTVVTAHLCLRCIHFLLSVWKFCTETTNTLGDLSIWLNSTCDKERRQREQSYVFIVLTRSGNTQLSKTL